MCLQKSPPSLHILWIPPLDSLLSYLHVLAEIPPNQLQIFWNLPLDSFLCYLHVLAEIPPPSLQILWNLPLDSLLSYLHVLAEIPPQFADFVKSSTGQFANLPICACRNSHPHSLKILWNLSLDSLLSYIYVLAEIPSQFADFVKSSTGQFAKLPIYVCRNSPHPCLQILWNLPLDRLLSYLHALPETPPVCRFCEICHWTVC